MSEPQYVVRVETPHGRIMWIHRGHLYEWDVATRFAYRGQAEKAAEKFRLKYPTNKSVTVLRAELAAGQSNTQEKK